MGNWKNRRRASRKKYFYNNYYQESDYDPPVVHTDGVPLWEIDFCKSMGVPWRKVVTVKEYIYCHESVLKWDDLAGEEAFHNAKRRYWAEINGLHFDDPPPDPDTYIDEVDWDSYIDPKLILDLDREFFNPDDEGKTEKLDTAVKVSCWSPVGNDKNACDSSDPWEKSVVQSSGNVKSAAQNWGQWDTLPNMEACHNPWEERYLKVDNPLKNSAWRGSADGSWGWYKEHKYNGQPSDVHEHCQGVKPMRTRGWGHAECNSWSLNNHKTDGHESWHLVHKKNRGGNSISSWNDKRRGDRRNQFQEFNQSDSVNDESRYMGIRDLSRGGRAPSGGYRKREGSFHHASRYKSSRLQANDQGIRHEWQR